MSTYRLRDRDVPTFFYGTAWKEADTARLTTLALEAGFLAIDTANQRKHYHEAAVGVAVRGWLEGGRATRESLFLQTKFTYRRGQDHRLPYDPAAPLAEQVAQSMASSLEHLGTDYVDSYVLHGPATPFGLHDHDREVWRAMERRLDDGQTRLLGVSNISLPQLQQLCDEARISPAFVQNRCFAHQGWDAEVRAFCRDHDILYQGFSLLTANVRELQHASVKQLCAEHDCSVAQLAFAFALGVGMIPLTGTSDPAHMRQDLEARTIALSDESLRAIEAIAT